MINEKANISVKGHVVMTKYDKDSNVIEVIEQDNAIDTAIALEVFRRAFADGDRVLDEIAVYETGPSLLMSKAIASKTYVSTNRVDFAVTYDESDFAGDMVQASLFCTDEGPFSTITFSTISKTNVEKFGIVWSITLSIS